MGSVAVKQIRLSCGHLFHYKTWLPEGDTLWCEQCGIWVDVKVPGDMAGQTYHAEYDCSTEPVAGKKGYYRTTCQKPSCTWTKEAKYHATMDGMHKHLMNTHTRWGNPMLEGF